MFIGLANGVLPLLENFSAALLYLAVILFASSRGTPRKFPWDFIP